MIRRLLSKLRPDTERVKRLLPHLIYQRKKHDIVTVDDLQPDRYNRRYVDAKISEHSEQNPSRTPLSLHFKLNNIQYQHQQYSFRRESVAELSDVAIVGEYGVGVTADGRYLKDLVTNSHVERIAGAIKYSIRQQPMLSVPRFENSIVGPRRRELPTIEHGCSLYNKWTNYYHWINEHLLKLRHLERYEQETGDRPTLIIPPDPPSYIIETLSLLGYTDSEWIEWAPPGVRVESLVVPTYPEPTPENLSWLRSKMWNRVDCSTTDTSRIYISREKSNKRLVENETAVRKTVAAFGFEPYFLEQLSVKEQIRLFSSADAVVAPHGAGLTNVLWGSDLTVFELFPEHVYDLYGVISSVLGHNYHALDFDSVTPRMGLNSNLDVDVERLHDCLGSTLET